MFTTTTSKLQTYKQVIRILNQFLNHSTVGTQLEQINTFFEIFFENHPSLNLTVRTWKLIFLDDDSFPFGGPTYFQRLSGSPVSCRGPWGLFNPAVPPHINFSNFKALNVEEMISTFLEKKNLRRLWLEDDRDEQLPIPKLPFGDFTQGPWNGTLTPVLQD